MGVLRQNTLLAFAEVGVERAVGARVIKEV